VGVGDLEEALLLAGFVKVERGDDHWFFETRFVCRNRMPNKDSEKRKMTVL
jgi:hypothetical protein